MSSRDPSETRPESSPDAGRNRPSALDLERDLPTTAQDVAALRRLRHRPITPRQYADLLAAVGHASYQELARRPGPRGEPFEL